MSGPKSGSYVLADRARIAEQERQRARNHARSRCDELAATLRQARSELERTAGLSAQLPSVPAWPGEDADTDTYRALDAEAARRLEDSRTAMAQARAARRSQQVRESLGATRADTQVRTAAEALTDQPAQPPTTRSQPEAARSVADTTLRLLDRLRDDAPAMSRAAVDDAVERLAQETTRSGQDRWVTELRHAVDLANRAAARRERDAERARLLLADLQRLAPPPATLVTGLEQVLLEDAELDDELIEQVRATVAAADAAEEAAVVAASVAEVLAELGYDVGEEFGTVLARDGLAHVRVDEPDWRDHGVRVRLDAQGRKLGFHLVRVAGRDEAAGRDAQLEADWCEDVPDVVAQVAGHGLQIDLTARTAPGELPVLEVPAETLGVTSADHDESEQRRAERDARDARRRRDRRRERRRPKERGR